MQAGENPATATDIHYELQLHFMTHLITCTVYDSAVIRAYKEQAGGHVTEGWPVQRQQSLC